MPRPALRRQPLRLHVPRQTRDMNRLEQAWALVLQAEQQQGRVQWWAYEPVRLRLGPGALYTPDFLVVTHDGQLRADECKGHWREAARVRIKVAAGLYPWIHFQAVQRQGRAGWKAERIGG